MPDIGSITEIRRKGRSQRRCEVLVGGEVVLEADHEVLAQHGLRRGLPLTSETLAEVDRADRVHEATRAALRLLGVRARSRREIRDALRRRHSPQIVDTVLARLEEAGLLNDEEFARGLAAELGQGRAMGARAIRYKLRQVGLAPELVERTLADLADPAAETERARLTAARYLSRQSGPRDARLRRRLFDHLLRRGFDAALCREILEEVLPPGEEPPE